MVKNIDGILDIDAYSTGRAEWARNKPDQKFLSFAASQINNNPPLSSLTFR